jgi:hypothetical protein
MRQPRGRRTSGELVGIALQGEPPRLEPPEYLNARERALFVELIEACNARQFAKSDLPLIAAYVQATLLSRQAIKEAATDPAMLALWEKATRAMTTLATKLRLTPLSRSDPKTILRGRPNPHPRPWSNDD